MRKQIKGAARSALSVLLSVSMVMTAAAAGAPVNTQETKTAETGRESAAEKDRQEKDDARVGTSSVAGKEESSSASKPVSGGKTEMDSMVLLTDETEGYDWRSDYEEYVGDHDVVTRVDMSYSDDPGVVLSHVFERGAENGDKKDNIEGPEGDNCYVEGAANWKDNGNLKVVDLSVATASDAARTAKVSLEDTHVFQYYLHDAKDFDRNTSIVDRQRIEIKTEAKNRNINSWHGEVLTNHWKFFLPEDTPLPDKGSFFHIFQTKATQGDEASMPVFTLSVTDEGLYFYGSDCGHVATAEEILIGEPVPMDAVLGRWIEAEIATYTAEKGYAYIRLQDVSDPENKILLLETGQEFDSWRRPERADEDGIFREYNKSSAANQMNRSKWGLYRKNDSPVPFEDVTMYLGDLQLVKHDIEDYVFPDGFDPKDQERDIYWAVEPEPLKVLEGTDFSNIYLPSRVSVYVEGEVEERVPVEWEMGEYDKAVKGEYIVTGTLDITGEAEQEKNLCNPNEVEAQMRILVTDDVSDTRVNWAMSREVGGTASIKAVSGTKDNPAEYLIDGNDRTEWATNSGLIAEKAEGNHGFFHWAAIDLGAERTFDEIYYELGSIGSSKQFRLHNFAMYSADAGEAYEELDGSTSGSPMDETKDPATPNPLETEHGSQWNPIPGVYKENSRDHVVDDSKQVTNNACYDFHLEEALTTRYVLICGEIETVDAVAGPIKVKQLKLIGDKELAEIPEITKVISPKLVTVDEKTSIDQCGLPDVVEVALSDGTMGWANVTWDTSSFRMGTEGIYRVTGALSFPDDRMQNTEYLTAVTAIEVKKP
ncbi:MAG: Ig-like domain-containing protein, partial [Lachnospiraceae bacterium]|nr:Ig-like domain-containing protein [Lachnospiraceae bacterium]